VFLWGEIIVLKPGPARPGGSTWDPRLEPGRVNEKIGKIMTRCDPTDPAG